MLPRPAPGEFHPQFQSYIDRVPEGDVLAHLERQGKLTTSLLADVGEDRAAGGLLLSPTAASPLALRAEAPRTEWKNNRWTCLTHRGHG